MLGSLAVDMKKHIYSEIILVDIIRIELIVNHRKWCGLHTIFGAGALS